MTSISEYTRQIENIDISDNLEKNISTLAEARELLKLCRNYQQQLRQIKKSVTLDVKSIRVEYKDKIANAGSVMGGAFSLFGKRGMGGSIRADAKRAMTRERDSVISPYEELKLVIDNYIHGIDDAKSQIDGFIVDLKENETEEKAKAKPPQSQGGFCTSCGAKIAKSHKFCSQCGNQVV